MFYNFRPNNTGDCYKIKSEQWHISEAEAKEALKVQGYDVTAIFR